MRDLTDETKKLMEMCNFARDIVLPRETEIQTTMILQSTAFTFDIQLWIPCMNRMTALNTIKTTNRQSNRENTLPYAIKLLLFDEETTCLPAQTPHPFKALAE